MMTNADSGSIVAEDSTQTIAQKALRRSRRWQILLAGSAGFFWLLLAASVIGIALFIMTFITPNFQHIAHEAAEGVTAEPKDMARLAKMMMIATYVLYYGSIVLAVLLIVAGSATLLYVRASHRAALRRIRTELADISSQLRLLHQNMQTV